MKNNYNNVDRLSDLPQGILHRIFSSIDMKHVVQTSILSKSWRNFWKSLPYLNFEGACEETGNCEGFEEFIDKVLNLHESPNLQSFRLHCHHPCEINPWILAALRKNVEEIYLHFCYDYPPSLPECIFSCKSLTVLDLKFLEIYDPESKLDIPGLMSLPRLRTLILENFWIDSDDLNKIISSCSVLESLCLIGGEFSQDNFHISSLSLKHLVIENCNPFQNSYQVGYNIKLYAPNLLSFRCESLLSVISIENLSALVKAEIDIELDDSDEDDGDDDDDDDSTKDCMKQMVPFLSGLHNVETLTLSDSSIKVVSRSLALLGSEPVQFCNLRCLKLRTCLSKDSFNAVTYLLKISPNIESLLLETEKVRPNSAKIEVQEVGALLQCMLYHLKFVEIRGVQGRLNELMFLEILLKNAMVLEKVILYVSTREQTPDAKRRLMKFTEELLISPRASSSIAIMLV